MEKLWDMEGGSFLLGPLELGSHLFRDPYSAWSVVIQRNGEGWFDLELFKVIGYFRHCAANNQYRILANR